jgi:hypothetical protein
MEDRILCSLLRVADAMFVLRQPDCWRCLMRGVCPCGAMRVTAQKAKRVSDLHR